jgi:putative cell wall-binding protein
VVIARGDNFPDALAAAYLAGQNGVPILLTRPNAVPPETFAALKATGATKVVLIGGTLAINKSVEDTLAATHTFQFGTGDQQDGFLEVTRVGGADRYQTARLVAEAPGLGEGGTLGIRTTDGCTAQKFAIVASGENFPDALAAGGLAYHGAHSTDDAGCGSGPIPLLLTQKDGLTPATVQALSDLGIQHVLVIGGTGAIGQPTFNAIDSLPGINATRVAGDTRQLTAIQLAETVLGPATIGNWDSGKAIGVRPDTFPDALTASSLSGQVLAPIYLTESGTTLGDDVAQAIIDYPVPTYIAALIGGTDALSNDVLTDLATAIASQPG